MLETQITFLETKVYKGVRFNKESILDVQTHYKPTETFQSPTRREERFHLRRSAQAPKD